MQQPAQRLVFSTAITREPLPRQAEFVRLAAQLPGRPDGCPVRAMHHSRHPKKAAREPEPPDYGAHDAITAKRGHNHGQ
jgi:hypothetical protein